MRILRFAEFADQQLAILSRLLPTRNLMRESEINRKDDLARDGKLNKLSYPRIQRRDDQETELMEQPICRPLDLDRWIVRADPRFISGEVREREDDAARVKRWLDLADRMLASDFHLHGLLNGDT